MWLYIAIAAGAIILLDDLSRLLRGLVLAVILCMFLIANPTCFAAIRVWLR